MTKQGNGKIEDVDLRPLVGLLAGVPDEILEELTVDAIRTHRLLIENAENLFQLLPPEKQDGKDKSGTDYVAYLKATIELHAQISALATLLKILGRTPTV